MEKEEFSIKRYCSSGQEDSRILVNAELRLIKESSHIAFTVSSSVTERSDHASKWVPQKVIQAHLRGRAREHSQQLKSNESSRSGLAEGSTIYAPVVVLLVEIESWINSALRGHALSSLLLKPACLSPGLLR